MQLSMKPFRPSLRTYSYKSFESFIAWFLNPDQTVQSDQVNREPLINTFLLILRIGLCQKNKEPFEPWSNCAALRTMIRPVLMVLYFPLSSTNSILHHSIKYNPKIHNNEVMNRERGRERGKNPKVSFDHSLSLR